MRHQQRLHTIRDEGGRLRALSASERGEQFSHLEVTLREVGTMIKSLRQSTGETGDDFELRAKLDGSFVTKADLASSSLVTSAIRRIYGDVILLSEEDESSFRRFVERDARKSAWVLDPLDNTRGYVQGRDDYSVLLTHVVGNSAQDAFIVHPAQDSIIQAHLGYGVYRNRSPMNVSVQSSFENARCIGVYTHECFSRHVSHGPSESTEALVAVACGDLDIAIIKMCGHKIWDIAFASLLVGEAGGVVSDEAGAPLLLHELSPTCEWIIASNGRLHVAALEWFARTLSSL